MGERRSFLLRVDPAVLEAVQRWANDDLRSLNGQIEFLLRRALQETGRMKTSKHRSETRGAGDALGQRRRQTADSGDDETR